MYETMTHYITKTGSMPSVKAYFPHPFFFEQKPRETIDATVQQVI